mmetsp:Transcript_20818/g.48677  ORF Transcript_20818/g.48677 Transcript_20818/m.48677 type:complete len:191 (-) Transcript_20818:114-686(-)
MQPARPSLPASTSSSIPDGVPKYPPPKYAAPLLDLGQASQEEAASKEKFLLRGIIPMTQMSDPDVNFVSFLNPHDPEFQPPPVPGTEFYLPADIFRIPKHKMKHKHANMHRYTACTLFYMYYTGDREDQCAASGEMCKRGMKFHGEHRAWYFMYAGRLAYFDANAWRIKEAAEDVKPETLGLWNNSTQAA